MPLGFSSTCGPEGASVNGQSLEKLERRISSISCQNLNLNAIALGSGLKEEEFGVEWMAPT